MRYGFDGNIYFNVGTAAAPNWGDPIDTVGDPTIEDDSDKIDTTVKSTNGVKTTGRGLVSRNCEIELESNAAPTGFEAALIAASRTRNGFVDLFFSDTGIEDGAKGFRMLALVTMSDPRKIGDRWVRKYELSPARASGDWLTEGVPPLDLEYVYHD